MKHAWTVVCSKTIIDSDSNNISLDVAEQLSIQGVDAHEGKQIVIPGFSLTIASLWYRDNPTKGEKGNARIRYLGPSNVKLSELSLNIDLEKASRMRTRISFTTPRFNGPGWYFFVVEEKNGNKWVEVARIPYELAIHKKNR